MLLYVHFSGFQKEVMRGIEAIEGIKSAECYDGDYVCVVALDDDQYEEVITRKLRSLKYVTKVERGR